MPCRTIQFSFPRPSVLAFLKSNCSGLPVALSTSLLFPPEDSQCRYAQELLRPPPPAHYVCCPLFVSVVRLLDFWRASSIQSTEQRRSRLSRYSHPRSTGVLSALIARCARHHTLPEGPVVHSDLICGRASDRKPPFYGQNPSSVGGTSTSPQVNHSLRLFASRRPPTPVRSASQTHPLLPCDLDQTPLGVTAS